jgi:putative adhesin
MKKTFDTPEPASLDVRLAAGTLVVEAAETAQTEVEVEPLDDGAEELMSAVRVELRGSRDVQIDLPERRGFLGRNPHFGVRVRCPLDSRLGARVRSADVQGRGRLGAADVKSASGDVSLEWVAGEARVQTASGDVEIERAGTLTVNTASGEATVGECEGALSVNLVSGDLTVRAAGGSVETHTVSGDQRLEAVGPAPVSANSVSGDVLVRVRRGATVWLDVRSISGDTQSDLELGDGPPADRAAVMELRVNTVSGDVRIERAAAAAATPTPD